MGWRVWLCIAPAMMLWGAASARDPASSAGEWGAYNSILSVSRRTSRKATQQLLELQSVNFLFVTDVHAWLLGHAHQPQYGADYADLLSFIEHTKTRAQKEGKDVFFFNNGDIVDGTALSNMNRINGADVLPIIKKMPFDAIDCGNHELYQNATINNLVESGFIEHWEGRYLTANIKNATTGHTLGEKYRIIQGTELGTRVLVFGFLYDFKKACKAVEVVTCLETVQSEWFSEVLGRKDSYDMIVFLLHMPHGSDETKTIYTATRDLVGDDVPIVLITGHSHVESAGYTADNLSPNFEADHYLQRVGFISYDTTTRKFMKEDILMNQGDLALACNRTIENLSTSNGDELRALITETSRAVGAEDVIGCLQIDGDYDHLKKRSCMKVNSLSRLYKEHVGSTLFLPSSLNCGPQAHFVSGKFRYDLFEGPVTVNDLVTVSPFRNGFFAINNVSKEILNTAYWSLRNDNPGDCYMDMYSARHDNDTAPAYQLLLDSYHVPVVQAALIAAGMTEEQVVSVPYIPFNGIDGQPLDALNLWLNYWYQERQEGCPVPQDGVPVYTPREIPSPPTKCAGITVPDNPLVPEEPPASDVPTAAMPQSSPPAIIALLSITLLALMVGVAGVGMWRRRKAKQQQPAVLEADDGETNMLYSKVESE